MADHLARAASLLLGARGPPGAVSLVRAPSPPSGCSARRLSLSWAESQPIRYAESRGPVPPDRLVRCALRGKGAGVPPILDSSEPDSAAAQDILARLERYAAGTAARRPSAEAYPVTTLDVLPNEVGAAAARPRDRRPVPLRPPARRSSVVRRRSSPTSSFGRPIAIGVTGSSRGDRVEARRRHWFPALGVNLVIGLVAGIALRLHGLTRHGQTAARPRSVNDELLRGHEVERDDRRSARRGSPGPCSCTPSRYRGRSRTRRAGDNLGVVQLAGDRWSLNSPCSPCRSR